MIWLQNRPYTFLCPTVFFKPPRRIEGLLTPRIRETGRAGVRCLVGLGKKRERRRIRPSTPPRLDGGGTAWRRRPRDAAASTIHVDTPRTRQPPLVLSPRSPCTIGPLCLPSGTHFDGGSAAYQNTMPLTRLPGCTKCRSDDSDALLGRRSRSRRRGGVRCLSAGCDPSHRSNPTDPDSTQMGETSILSLFWNQLKRRRCVYWER